MSNIERYEVTAKDIAKDKMLKHLSWATIPVLTFTPGIVFLIIGLLSASPASVAFFFFLAFISSFAGFFFGALLTAFIFYYRSNWLKKLREKIAADGIHPDEIEWFKSEMTSAEKKALQEIEARDKLLADAYRETLASRLTATRVINKVKEELLYIQRKVNSVKNLQKADTEGFLQELKRDEEKLKRIRKEAEQMLDEAKARLQMIEVTAHRGGSVADMELALKKLSARARELPLALEAIRIEEQLRRQLEEETTQLLS
ncbi:MAG: hypothetical protein D6687_08695 [Acidobacteria bacterium]|jgi:hypothetical protein|nr:MAG: hypothetical protein D6687_08695 [Acidobacteriota bacterium]GIU82214.1 MAG: hypothetical protein KatS3mg006_1278 [Pyrinomonadaceae bacterium]